MSFVRKFAAAAAGAFLAVGCAQALENTVTPDVTAPLAKAPKVALLVGNSYSFYNCGVHTYLRGFMQNGTPEGNDENAPSHDFFGLLVVP